MINKTEKYNHPDTQWVVNDPIGQYGILENAGSIVEPRHRTQQYNTRLGELGFYTTNPQVLQERIDEIEKSVEMAEGGNDSEWLTADEFDKELQQEFLWLR